jgi:hypothetical protein
MIIAINGKIGSGKDTVGKIIQLFTYLNNECDWSKNEVQKALKDLHKGNIDSLIHDIGIGKGYGNWQIKKFAGKLKEIASILTVIPIEKFEDQEFKQKQMSEGWEMTYREFLQKLGTEAMRNRLHTNVWCNALFADYVSKFNPTNTILDEMSDMSYKNYYPNWIITDLRFPNEFQTVKDRNGICVRVRRDFIKDENGFLICTGGGSFTNLHPSEIALDNHIFDYELFNSGSIEDLVEEVRKMLINFKII